MLPESDAHLEWIVVLRALSLLVVAHALASGSASALTIDALGFDDLTSHTFQADSGSLERFFRLQSYRYSDGSRSLRGAGSSYFSYPRLDQVSVSDGRRASRSRARRSPRVWVVRASFVADPDVPYLTEFTSFLSTGSVQMTFTFETLEITGTFGSSRGAIVGTALLAADTRSINASVPVGTIVPIFGDIVLADGATFDLNLFDADFNYRSSGMVLTDGATFDPSLSDADFNYRSSDMVALPEPGTAPLILCGLAMLAGRRRVYEPQLRA